MLDISSTQVVVPSERAPSHAEGITSGDEDGGDDNCYNDLDDPCNVVLGESPGYAETGQDGTGGKYNQPHETSYGRRKLESVMNDYAEAGGSDNKSDEVLEGDEGDREDCTPSERHPYTFVVPLKSLQPLRLLGLRSPALFQH